MKLDTKKEAEEYFEHNPKEKEVYFIMVDKIEIEAIMQNAYIDPYILKTETNKGVK